MIFFIVCVASAAECMYCVRTLCVGSGQLEAGLVCSFTITVELLLQFTCNKEQEMSQENETRI